MEWKMPVAATRGQSAAPNAQPVLPDACETLSPPVQRAASLALLGRAELRCDGAMTGEVFGLNGLIGNSDAIARFVPLDRGVQTFRLTASAPTATILAEASTAQVLQDYFIIGAEHILFGWDHLLFVIALVLLVRAPWPVVKAATAFTVAHSITLVATTLGYAGLPSRPVEALIALSIVFLAVEIALVLREPERQTFTRRFPWVVAFGFGLFHGFGFAGALSEIGLPQGEIAIALLAFNLGVEAGQLLVIAGLAASLALLIRAAPKIETPAIRFAAYAIGATGSFWLIERVIG
jgi:hydrogenase/urease accessory protein HupE